MENFSKQIKSIASQFSDKKSVLVVGGGEVNTSRFVDYLDDKLIININDSVFKLSGHIVIVKSRHALEHILKNDAKIRDRQFIIPIDIIEPNEISLFDNLTIIDDLEEFMQYDFDLFNNMPIFGCLIADLLGFDYVQLTGFTFDFDDYVGESQKYNKVYFKKQLKELNRFCRTHPKLEVVRHNPVIRTRESKNTIKSVIDNRLSNNETIIVAEFTNNHLGDENTLFKMVRLAKEQGADLIKIQKRDVDNFYTEEEKNKSYTSKFGNTLYSYRKGVELSQETLIKFDEICENFNIPWFSTVLDLNSYNALNEVKKQTLIKLPSTISNFRKYLNRISIDYPADQDLVISTGATSMEYVKFVLDHFYNEKRRLFLLHTLSAYPTPIEEINIGVINLYKKLQQDHPLLYPGYSGHDIGVFGTQMAIAAGAVMVEKHVKLEDNEWIHFDGVASSLNDGEFGKYVEAVRYADKLRGKEAKNIHSIEHHKYNNTTDKD